MKMSMVIALVVSLGSLLAAERGSSVNLINGNVFVTAGDRKPRQLTSSGKDYDPSLSPDGKLVVFARAVGEPMDNFVGQPRGLFQHSEVWMVGVDGRGSRRLFAGEIHEGKFRYIHFFNPTFSPDLASVYFLIPYAAVTDGLVKLDVRTSHVRFLAPVINYVVLDKGAYRGFLLVQRRVPFDQGYDYPFFLLSPDGELVRQIADDEASAKAFIERERGGTSAPVK